MNHIQLTLLLIVCALFPSQLDAQADTTAFPYIDHFNSAYFEKQVFAHRGGYANGPENTQETILFNLQRNIHCIEIDIQLTKDKQLVLFHDETIERVLQTERVAKVNELTLAELKKIPLRDKRLGEVYITAFSDLVDTLTKLIPARKMDFLLELDWKPHGDDCEVAIQELLRIVKPKAILLGDSLYNYFFLSSFYPEVLKTLHRLAPEIVTGYAMHNNPDKGKFMARLGVLAAPIIVRRFDVEIVEPNMCMTTPRLVRKWHRRKRLVCTYTPNSACEKAYVQKLGIAYTTNCPDGTCVGDPSDQPGKPKKWCKKCAE